MNNYLAGWECQCPVMVSLAKGLLLALVSAEETQSLFGNSDVKAIDATLIKLQSGGSFANNFF